MLAATLLVVQPNGFYGVFDPVRRDFQRINLTRDEAFEYVIQAEQITKREIVRHRMHKAKKVGVNRWHSVMVQVMQFKPACDYEYLRSRMQAPALTYGEVQA